MFTIVFQNEASSKANPDIHEDVQETQADLPNEPPPYTLHEHRHNGRVNPSFQVDADGNEITIPKQTLRRRVVTLLPGLVMINKDVGTPHPIEEPVLKRRKKKLADLSEFQFQLSNF